MENLNTLRHRVIWTRGWLNNFTTSRTTNLEDFELVDHDDATCSDYGVVALSDHGSESTVPTTTTSGFETPDETVLSREPDLFNVCTVIDQDPVAESGVFFHPSIAYEMAGRTPDHAFSDMRSAYKAKRRTRTDREKYWNYRAVKPGQRGGLHREFNDEFNFDAAGSTLPCDADVVKFTPRMMYNEAQTWPRPPTYHRRRGEKDYSPWRASVEKRAKLWKHQDWWDSNEHVNIRTVKYAGDRLANWIDERSSSVYFSE